MRPHPYRSSSGVLALLAHLQPLHTEWSDMRIVQFLSRITKKSKITGSQKNTEKKHAKNEENADPCVDADSLIETKDVDSNTDKGSKTEIEKEKPDLHITQQHP